MSKNNSNTKFEMGDEVRTPNGTGRVISLPATSKSSLYTVLLSDNQAVLMDASELVLLDKDGSQ